MCAPRRILLVQRQLVDEMQLLGLISKLIAASALVQIAHAGVMKRGEVEKRTDVIKPKVFIIDMV